ncbi:hypothetical protein [Streptomyces sp. CC224B]|uniref:hypothetical protein n=1 Tax=Streptomyces sp. CC224B TaxID=3044571 RepID=UPI0024A80F38|nr:hypothetical protein [Streptomyces sp. CC224B]
MATVELHIADELLHDFETIRPALNGREIGRRPSPTCDACTILDMAMADAPAHAKTMEIILQRVDNQPVIKEIHYWDERGDFIAPAVPFREVTG